MRNERGLTLIDLLVWIALSAVIGTASFKIISLQVEHMQQSQYAKFYDEINSIDSYLQEFAVGSVVSHGENFIELSNTDKTVRLDDTGKGVTLSSIDSSTGAKMSVRFTFIRDFEVYPIDTLVIKGTRDATDLLYRVPINNTLQVFYNTQPQDGIWFKEVVTYAFE